MNEDAIIERLAAIYNSKSGAEQRQLLIKINKLMKHKPYLRPHKPRDGAGDNEGRILAGEH